MLKNLTIIAYSPIEYVPEHNEQWRILSKATRVDTCRELSGRL